MLTELTLNLPFFRMKYKVKCNYQAADTNQPELIHILSVIRLPIHIDDSWYFQHSLELQAELVRAISDEIAVLRTYRELHLHQIKDEYSNVGTAWDN